MKFGSDSQYYRIYRKDPASARKLLWNTYRESGLSIRAVARKMGCSRNTVRSVLRRVQGSAPLWDNRPSTPRSVEFAL
jgi:transposase